jgi:hypothetical protein
MRSCRWARHGLAISSTLGVSSRMLSLSTDLLKLRLKFNFYKFYKLMLYYSALRCKIFYIKCCNVCNKSFVDPLWVVKHGWFGFPRGHPTNYSSYVALMCSSHKPSGQWDACGPYNLGDSATDKFSPVSMHSFATVTLFEPCDGRNMLSPKHPIRIKSSSRSTSKDKNQ